MPAKKTTTGRALGGVARAKRLSPEERSAIATRAAKARWSEDVGQVICGSPDKPLKIGEIEIECYVLDDDTRVLTQSSFLQSLGRHPRANVRRVELESGEERLPPILQGKALKPFISREILEKSRPITFALPRGGRASGYNAELLPAVCEIYLKAREAGVLPSNQMHVAQQAELLVRGLARVGIIALVDEATGYQEVRAKTSLVEILEAFIASELQPWVSTFPDDFYSELFRLRGLEYPRATVQATAVLRPLDERHRVQATGPRCSRRATKRDAKGRARTPQTQVLPAPDNERRLSQAARAPRLGGHADEAEQQLGGLHAQARSDPPARRRHDPDLVSAGSRRLRKRPLGGRLPAGLCSSARGFAALLSGHLLGARLPALQATFAPERDRRWVLAGVRGHVLHLASRDVHDELCDLVRVAWTLA